MTTEGVLPDPAMESGKEGGTRPAAWEATRTLDLYMRDTLGSVFRNMNSFQPGRRKPVKPSDVEMYARMYLDIRRLFLDS